MTTENSTTKKDDTINEPTIKVRRVRRRTTLRRKYPNADAATRALNKKRRIRYRDDPKYRQRVVQASRRVYRARAGITKDDIKHLAINDLEKLKQIGVMRKILDCDGCAKTEKQLTFTVTELAEALGGYDYHVMQRWMRQGQLPPMTSKAMCHINTTNGQTRRQLCQVYYLEELQAILNPLRAHQREIMYFKVDHTDVIENIRNRMKRVRKGEANDNKQESEK